MHPSAEDFELYLQNRLSDLQAAAMESHLSVCDLCASRVSGQEDRRRAARTPCAQPATMQVLHPLSLDHLEVEVCDASPYGVGLRCPIFIAPGSEVKIRIGESISFGQVRYCIPSGNEFRAGVKIRDIF